KAAKPAVPASPCGPWNALRDKRSFRRHSNMPLREFRRSVDLEIVLGHPILVCIDIDALGLRRIGLVIGGDLQDLEIAIAGLFEPVTSATGNENTLVCAEFADDLVANAVESHAALDHVPGGV